jgi:acetylornithine deacetylase
VNPSADTIRRLEKLISFPTVSRDSNLDLIEWVSEELAGYGLASRLTYDRERRKANLLATIGTACEGAGLVLSGHTDVVPVDGQTWSTDPFHATIVENGVYGRGAADMKGFIAAVLAAVPQMLEAADRSCFHIALSYDEELGCLGAPGLIEDLCRAGARPGACIVGEPTEMGLVIGHKGASVYRCRIHGRAQHSARAPDGVNAIDYAARLISRLCEMDARLRRTERRHPSYDIGHSTLNVGVIRGGVASNIVPEDCEFRFDIRHLPWTDARAIVHELEEFARAELVPDMRSIAPEASVVFECVGEVPALETDADLPLVRLASQLLETTAAPTRVGFGSEAGLFDAAGIPTVICGPGSIAQAHQADEFVTFGQLARCERFLRRLIDCTDFEVAGERSCL